MINAYRDKLNDVWMSLIHELWGSVYSPEELKTIFKSWKEILSEDNYYCIEFEREYEWEEYFWYGFCSKDKVWDYFINDIHIES